MSTQIYLVRQYTSKLGRTFPAGEFFTPEEFEEDVLADLIRLNYALPLERDSVIELQAQEQPKTKRRGRPAKYETREMRGS